MKFQRDVLSDPIENVHDRFQIKVNEVFRCFSLSFVRESLVGDRVN